MRSLTIGLIALMLMAGAAHAAETCAKATSSATGDCAGLAVNFDFSDCHATPKSAAVKAKCWNDKAVASKKTDQGRFIATFEMKDKKWALTGLRSEPIANGEAKAAAAHGSGHVAAGVAVAAAATTAAATHGAAVAKEAAAVMKTEEKAPEKAAEKVAEKTMEKPAEAKAEKHEAVERKAAAEEPPPAPPVKVAQMATPEPPPAAMPAAAAASGDEGWKMTGGIDFYYAYNGNKPNPVTAPTATNLTQPGGNNTYRVFDIYHDDFNIAMADVVVSRKKGNVTALIDLAAGHNADVLSATDEVSKHIPQAFLTYTPAQLPRLTLAAGKMYTHLGLEVTRAKDNWNYSRSILFGYAIPFWHTGVAATYAALPGKLNTSLYLYNANSGLYENNKNKTFGAQLNATPMDGLSLVYNFLGGAERNDPNRYRNTHELNGTYNILPSLAAQFDFVTGSETKAKTGDATGRWTAWSLAARWSCHWYALSPRFEMFDDSDGIAVTSGTEQKLQSITVTNSFDLGDGLETRLEFRQDKSDKTPFTDPDGVATDKQMTATLAILYNM